MTKYPSNTPWRNDENVAQHAQHARANSRTSKKLYCIFISGDTGASIKRPSGKIIKQLSQKIFPVLTRCGTFVCSCFNCRLNVDFVHERSVHWPLSFLCSPRRNPRDGIKSPMCVYEFQFKSLLSKFRFMVKEQ